MRRTCIFLLGDIDSIELRAGGGHRRLPVSGQDPKGIAKALIKHSSGFMGTALQNSGPEVSKSRSEHEIFEDSKIEPGAFKTHL